MVGAAARGAKQSPCSLIGQSTVIDVTSDSFQREEKCLSDSKRPARRRSASGNAEEKQLLCKRYAAIKFFKSLS